MSPSFRVLLLGTNSALPCHGRHPSGQYLQFSNFHFLLDCGEGTQDRLIQHGVKKMKIDHIFISHLHGDHIYGLPGLLGSFTHAGRLKKLTIYGPKPLKDYVFTTLNLTQSRITFELEIVEVPDHVRQDIQISPSVSVQAFPLDHRITSIGYVFDYIPIKKNIRKETLRKYDLSIEQIRKAVHGEDIELIEGEVLKNDQITYQKIEPKRYAFCSDTAYYPAMVEFIKDSDLLFHETTYLDDLEAEAKERKHSTIGQAIKILEKSGSKKLLTGHYSSRYHNLAAFQKIAEKSSLPVIIGEEGKYYNF